jgi:group I intron endonuclease
MYNINRVNSFSGRQVGMNDRFSHTKHHSIIHLIQGLHKMSQNNYVIYKFTSPSGKSYIGQTNNLNRRIGQHKSKSGCTAFSSAIKKYGWDKFLCEILKENLTIDEANHWEEFYIREHNTLSPCGYNLATGGLNSLLSEESRAKISKKLTGVPRSEELKEKLRVANTGRKQSPESIARRVEKLSGKIHSSKAKEKMSDYAKNRSDEHRKKLSESQKGRLVSQETREKISKSNNGRVPPNKGKSPSLETRKKQSESHIGKTLPEEQKKKISYTLKAKGRKNTPEQIAKLCEAQKNRLPISDEARKRMSDAQKAYHAKKRSEKQLLEQTLLGDFKK